MTLSSSNNSSPVRTYRTLWLMSAFPFPIRKPRGFAVTVRFKRERIHTFVRRLRKRVTDRRTASICLFVTIPLSQARIPTTPKLKKFFVDSWGTSVIRFFCKGMFLLPFR